MSTGLGRVILLAVVTAVVSLLVTESYQATPWLAGRVMRWSARLRYADNPKRAQVRGEELIVLLGDLPTLLTLPTAAAFLLRALAYCLTHCRHHARRAPRTAQRSLGVRFRVALVKAVLVVIPVGAVFGTELVLAVSIIGDLSGGGYDRSPGPSVGIEINCSPKGIVDSAACNYVNRGGFPVSSRPSSRIAESARQDSVRLSVVLVQVLRAIFADPEMSSAEPSGASLMALFDGVAFGMLTVFTGVLIGKFKRVGVIIGVLANTVGVASVVFVYSLAQYGTWWVLPVVVSGFGLSAGVLAGFAVARIRMSGSAPAVLADSLSGAGALNPEPSIPMEEPLRQE